MLLVTFCCSLPKAFCVAEFVLPCAISVPIAFAIAPPNANGILVARVVDDANVLIASEITLLIHD